MFTNRARRDETGFTLVELLTTLVVAGLYITLFFQMYSLVDRISSDSYRLATSNQVTYHKLQSYENRDFAAIPVLNGETPTEVEDFTGELPAGLPQPSEAKVFTAQVTPTLKALTVRTAYGTGSQRIIEYSSYIQESGLGR